jgi:integrase/recombinase XerD
VLHGKGGKDRYVPLPQCALTMRRAQWRTHRHPVWLFPARWAMANGLPQTATGPMAVRGVQHAFRAAVAESGLPKPATVHTLRHACTRRVPAQLREAGVNLRLIQVGRGEVGPRPTAGYPQLTRQAAALATDALQQLRAGRMG